MPEQCPIVRMYFAPLSSPCGPQSSCCGPVGQSEEEVAGWRSAIQKGLGEVQVESINVAQPLRLGRDDSVLRLLKIFGQQACPIVTVNGEVASMGPPVMEELLVILRSKIAPGTSREGA